MAAPSLLTEDVRRWIGAEATYTAPEPLGEASIRYFARAVGDCDPIHTDKDAARGLGYDTVIACPTFVAETNQYWDGQRDETGYFGHRWDLPITDCRLMRGSHHYVFGRPVRPTDVLHVHWRLLDIVEKVGRSGLPMLLVTSQVEIVDQDGEFLARNTEVLIHQSTAGEGTSE